MGIGTIAVIYGTTGHRCYLEYADDDLDVLAECKSKVVSRLGRPSIELCTMQEV